MCSTGICHLCVYQKNNLYSEFVGNVQIVHLCMCASKFVCLSFCELSVKLCVNQHTLNLCEFGAK